MVLKYAAPTAWVKTFGHASPAHAPPCGQTDVNRGKPMANGTRSDTATSTTPGSVRRRVERASM